MRSESTQKEGGFKWSTLTGKLPGGHKPMLKLPKIWVPKAAEVRRNSAPAPAEPREVEPAVAPASAPPAPLGPPRPPAPLTFEQHLAALHLSEAGRLLLAREERLFAGGGLRPPEVVDADALEADRRALEDEVLRTLRTSLDADADAQVLRSAVSFVELEEEQDQIWERRRGGTLPSWRLRCWRQAHDATLQSLVEERMEAPPTPAALRPGHSSIQADVHSMGRRLRRDLLLVLERVETCYPAHLRICRQYAAWYHRCVGAKLAKLADFGLDDQDCTFLLRWVNDFYPRLLQELEAAGELDTRALDCLLPKDLLAPLEEQYLSKQQGELSTYLGRILDEARETWTEGGLPPSEDGCFASPLAYDIIQMVNGMVSAAEKVLGDLPKARTLTCQLQDLLRRFATFQADVIKRNKANSAAFVKANLGCVAQFRDFLASRSRLFPEDVRRNCLRTLTDMKGSAHEYLLGPVHKNLKPHYRKLFSQEWLKTSTLDKLQRGLEDEMLQLEGPSKSCRQELTARLHRDVAVEYVYRLLKAELKLKDKLQQRQAADNVERDAGALRDFFGGHGSEEAWLHQVLIMIAEVLKLQDLPAIQFQVASLGTAFPDLSEKHVLSLLKLKSNLTKEDKNNVKAVLLEIPKDSAQSQAFFSFVAVK
ncbi:tumor necrosis factor alpha-induced protein 2-like [Syngnathoides biaculeatus]|uniref:tumor necrosis factor alpha-induced protein 2-like n=1 Tax=Syngnathoides biaculeatus TaxID=300417 RepID=UPI002ADD3C72|nr:tumor necrosis factor alpha-induced protein 2-like [Syngnathoides biaculeatus]